MDDEVVIKEPNRFRSANDVTRDFSMDVSGEDEGSAEQHSTMETVHRQMAVQEMRRCLIPPRSTTI